MNAPAGAVLLLRLFVAIIALLPVVFDISVTFRSPGLFEKKFFFFWVCLCFVTVFFSFYLPLLLLSLQIAPAVITAFLLLTPLHAD